MTFWSTPPRCLTSSAVSARSSGDLPKTFGGALSNSGFTTWQTRSMSYSKRSIASASCGECRMISLMFSSRSCVSRR